MNDFLWNFKRIVFDALGLIAIFLIAVFLPPSLMSEIAKAGLLSIFMAKFIFVSAGIIHAHISRKLLWPYIDFNKNNDWTNNLMIIAWYVTIILSWSRGG
jgi:hypothetical protein